MIRFILRRLLQMIPTIFGVILITFILFNLVGGSPAAMTLGEKSSARQLEDFDEERGFNRPLLFGRTVTTRAYIDTDFHQTAGPWSGRKDVTFVAPGGADSGGYIRLTGGMRHEIPLAFDLYPSNRYVWTITYRSSESIQWRGKQATNLPPSATWNTMTISDDLDASPDGYRPSLVATDTLDISELSVRRHVDQPWRSQLLHYIGQVLRLDFGYSYSLNRPVIDLLKRGIGPTLALTVPILTGELLISVSLALLCAYYRDRFLDRMILVGSIGLMSVNYLVWIVAGQYLLGYALDLFPVWGFESWYYLVLPVSIGVLHGLGANVRFYRTVMLDEMYRDYVRTAHAKGVGTAGVLFRHVLRNAMIPVITNVVLTIPFLYTGSLLLESFFGIPGLGYLSVNAINSSDVDVVRAVVLFGSFLYLAANLFADLCYAWVDPRVKLT